MLTRTESYSEIFSQETAWQEAVRTTLQQRGEIEDFLRSINPGQVIFAGCTSPYYAGSAAAAYWKTETGLVVESVPSSELVLFPELYYPKQSANPMMVVLSRSGKTTETIWAVEEFEKRFPGRVMLIGCNPSGPLAEMASLKIFLTDSAENTIAQTRSLSAMYLSALLMATLYSGNTAAMDILKNSPGIVNGILQKSEPVIQALFNDRPFNNLFILGSGPLYGIAREAGLKCMEMSTTDTFSYQFLESRHGPRVLIDENTLVVGLYSQAGLNYEAQVMEELTLNHQATTLAITPTERWNTGEVTAAISVDAGWPDGLIGLPYLPVTQIIAYYAASSKGLNPDVARFHSPYVVINRYSSE